MGYFWLYVCCIVVLLVNLRFSLLEPFSEVNVKLFYLSLRQHLNQLQTAVEDLTYIIHFKTYSYSQAAQRINRACLSISTMASKMIFVESSALLDIIT